MNARLLGLRLALLAPLVALSTVLVLQSSLWTLAPFLPPVWLIPLVLALVFAPALFTRGTPLVWTLAALTPILALASYQNSRLDWLRLLKNFQLTDDSGPSVLRIILALAAILLAWALHAADHAHRLRTRAKARGIDPAQAKGAARHVLIASGTRAATALAATGALTLVVITARLIDASLLAGRAALLAPLATAALVAIAALLLTRGATKRAGP